MTGEYRFPFFATSRIEGHWPVITAKPLVSGGRSG